ncbi:ribonuclease H2, subunit B [Collybia nuda]|uniref:Ribonuclease H2 subunit B n=1 Tax=Collybia nuda TaxID=64659 RepID=A0A9P5YLR3_9AGAR|nr:ribonuclease H2, subunit B [Collybia nuda]
MATHLGIFPMDILHSLSTALQLTQIEKNKELEKTSLLRLPHPRTGIPSLFISCESSLDKGQALSQSRILEVQAVHPPDSRSWFMGSQVLTDGKLLIITPIDPVFLLIPILRAARQDDRTPDNFLPPDDIFEAASIQLQSSSQTHQDQSLHVLAEDILRFVSLTCVKTALKCICDVKDITEEIVVYRFSLSKTTEYLRTKVARLSAPPTLEISRTLVRGFAKDGLMEDGKGEILKAGQIRSACDLLCQYLPVDIRATLVASYDFQALDSYLKTTEMEAASLTVDKKLRAKGQNNKLMIGEEKKRKIANTSQGVQKLKKVNVNGIAKLSSFFKKS